MNTVQQRGILRASDETTWKGKYFIKRFLSAWQALPMAPQQCADVLTPTTTKLKNHSPQKRWILAIEFRSLYYHFSSVTGRRTDIKGL